MDFPIPIFEWLNRYFKNFSVLVFNTVDRDNSQNTIKALWDPR